MSINQGLSAALVCVERPMAAPNEAAADTSWDVYDPTREYQRLKLVPGPLCKQRSKAKWPWRIAHVNKDYSFCATYPKAFVVPSSVSDEDLWRSRRFRMKERVPAIVYLHHNGACISRYDFVFLFSLLLFARSFVRLTLCVFQLFAAYGGASSCSWYSGREASGSNETSRQSAAGSERRASQNTEAALLRRLPEPDRSTRQYGHGWRV